MFDELSSVMKISAIVPVIPTAVNRINLQLTLSLPTNEYTRFDGNAHSMGGFSSVLEWWF